MLKVFQKSNFKKGFTLVELLMAISLFTVVLVLTSGVFVDAFRLNRQSSLEQQIYADARYTLDRIAEAVRVGTIDYEEYYNQIVLSKKDQGAEYQNPYGANYGEYTKLFYHPGNPAGDYGKLCNNGKKWKPGKNCTFLTDSLDVQTGHNPYGDTIMEWPNYNSVCGKLSGAVFGRCDAAQIDRNIFDELYLVDAAGTQKTIFVKEIIGGDKRNSIATVSYVTMKGEDINGDTVADIFSCDKDAGFDCGGKSVADCGPDYRISTDDSCPLQNDKSVDNLPIDLDASKDFVPISPNRIHINDLKFFVAPLEDPFKAFAENDTAVQKVPHVTITMTVSPNAKMFPSAQNFQPLTLQETVSTILTEEVPTPIKGQYE